MSNEKILDNLLTDLKRGTIVLAVLLNTDIAMYGYSLVQKLKDQHVDIDKNTLYPLLRRLESQGLLKSEWDTTESRPRKYYIISEFGIVVCNKLKEEWIKINETIMKMMEV
jgi:DNA-binding PadR family transcriptional regulator